MWQYTLPERKQCSVSDKLYNNKFQIIYMCMLQMITVLKSRQEKRPYRFSHCFISKKLFIINYGEVWDNILHKNIHNNDITVIIVRHKFNRKLIAKSRGNDLPTHLVYWIPHHNRQNRRNVFTWMIPYRNIILQL